MTTINPITIRFTNQPVATRNNEKAARAYIRSLGLSVKDFTKQGNTWTQTPGNTPSKPSSPAGTHPKWITRRVKSVTFYNRFGGTWETNSAIVTRSPEQQEFVLGSSLIEVHQAWNDYETGRHYWGYAVDPYTKDYLAINGNGDTPQKVYFTEFDIL